MSNIEITLTQILKVFERQQSSFKIHNNCKIRALIRLGQKCEQKQNQLVFPGHNARDTV